MTQLAVKVGLPARGEARQALVTQRSLVHVRPPNARWGPDGIAGDADHCQPEEALDEQASPNLAIHPWLHLARR